MHISINVSAGQQVSGRSGKHSSVITMLPAAHYLEKHTDEGATFMNSLRTIDLAFTVVILALGVLMYLHYQGYKPEIVTKEDVATTINEVERYTDIKQLKNRYINHVKNNFKNHQVVDTLIEYVMYLFVGVIVFLILSITVLYKMEKRH
jgi:hypothetical protein